MVLDVYAARETDSLGISSESLRKLIPGGCCAAVRPADAAEALEVLVREGDVVVTLGAGDVTMVGPALLSRLRERTTV